LLAFHLTVGEAADFNSYHTLIALPEQAPNALLADQGYDADAIRTDLARHNIQAVIPDRSNRRIKIKHDQALCEERNHIERFFGRLKINRAIATRYDQLAESFLNMAHIAAARYWLQFVHVALFNLIRRARRYRVPVWRHRRPCEQSVSVVD
jgi:transposase